MFGDEEVIKNVMRIQFFCLFFLKKNISILFFDYIYMYIFFYFRLKMAMLILNK